MIESMEIRIKMCGNAHLEEGDTLVLGLYSSDGILGTRLISIEKKDGSHRSVNVVEHKRNLVKV